MMDVAHHGAGRAWLPLFFLAVLQLAGCAAPRLQADDVPLVAGKTYVVTGASSGFGRGVAERLGALRANVVLAARRTEVLREVAAATQAAGGTPLVVTADVGKPEDVQRLADAAVQRFGRIDVWINNAGVGAIGRFEEIPVEDHARVIDVNVKGVIYGSHVAMRHFRQQGQGTLVNIGSVESEVPIAYQATYAASKAAVLSLGRALNEELRLNGNDRIAVSTVMPWAADTPFFAHAANYTGRETRMVTLDDPGKVVEAIVWASLHPVEELPVGWKASGATFSHRLFPDLAERIAGNVSHRVQMDNAPPGPPTAGALHTPVRAGTEIDGGMRERMAQEKSSRAAQSSGR
jgi:short-subunit dehydrogenase